MSWRTTAAAVISKCIQEHPDAYESDLRKIISAAYPFGERKYHPYKIWLSEVKHQLHILALKKSQTMTLDLFRAKNQGA